MSSLPLADNQIDIQRGLTTSSPAIFIPFTTQELYQSGKESLYYGLNALSNNLIMVDAYRSGFLFCLFLSAVTHQALLVHILQYNIAARFFVHATFCRP